MNIKSLLIGSAALLAASGSTYAADAVVMAEPEPVEYVRVCDVYGAGFFYIPGTETCLKIGGYVRFQITGGTHNGTGLTAAGAAAGAGLGVNAGSGFVSYARFAPNVDARTETEWGTVRGYAEMEFNYGPTNNFLTAGTAVLPYGTTTTLHSAFIDIGGNSYFRIGRTWSPYGSYVPGGATINDGNYQLRRTNQLTYVFNGTNGTFIGGRAGLSGYVSLADDENGDWAPDAEAGIGYGWTGGWARATVGYDSAVGAPGTVSAWGAKAGVNFTFSPVNVYIAALYHSQPAFAAAAYSLGNSDWSVLGALNFGISPKATINFTAQWFNQTAFTGAASLNWSAALGMTYTPVTGLSIRPELAYQKAFGGGDAWTGVLRFQRSF